MKKGYLILIIALLTISTVTAVELNLTGSNILSRSANVNNAILDIVGLRYEPFPAQPGDYITAWVSVQNLGRETFKNAELEVIEDYPFTIDGPTKFDLGDIAPGQINLVKIEKIRIDENAVEGENNLKFIVPGPYLSKRTSELNITIRSVIPIIETKVETIPEKIPQGQEGEVKVTITNQDTSLIRDVNVKLSLPTELVAVGATPEKKISRLESGKSETVNFNVLANADAVGKAYKTNVLITFSDETGELITKNQTIGILVGDFVSYEANIEESDPFTTNKKGELVLSIANTGPNDINYLTIGLNPSKDYTVVSTAKVYLGNLEPDDFETNEFEIITHVQKEGTKCWIPFKCKTPKTLPLNVTLSYRDPYNTEYEESIILENPLYSSGQIKAYGLAPVGGFGLIQIIIIILLVVFVYLTWKNWRKEKDIGKASKEALKQEVRGIGRALGQLRWRKLKKAPKRIKRFFEE